MALVQPIYKPYVMPTGGLLSSAVGTTEAPLPPLSPDAPNSIMPTEPTTPLIPPAAPPTTSLLPAVNPIVASPTPPSINTAGAGYALEGQTAASNLNSLTSSDSAYIKQAEEAGLRTAQRRGLLNSSIASGASRGAAISAAAPIALADTAASNQRDLTRLDAGFQGDRLNATLTQQQQLQTQSLQAASDQLGRQLTAQEQQAVLDRVQQQYLQTQELGSRQTLQTQMLASESERLGRQLTAQEATQVRDIADRQYQQQQDIGSRASLQTQSLTVQQSIAREDAAAQLARLGFTEAAANLRANLSAATQVQVQTLQNLNQTQQTQLQYYSQQQSSYLSALAGVWNNENIPAPARQDAINMFASVLNSGVNIPAAVYGVQMNWPGGVTAPPPVPGTAPAPVAPAPGTVAPATSPYTLPPNYSYGGILGSARV